MCVSLRYNPIIFQLLIPFDNIFLSSFSGGGAAVAAASPSDG